MSKVKFMLHSAVTIMGDKGPLLVGIDGRPMYMNPNAQDKEICQFAAECKDGMPEHHFRAAFREMEEACLQKARENGLVRSR